MDLVESEVMSGQVVERFNYSPRGRWLRLLGAVLFSLAPAWMFVAGGLQGDPWGFAVAALIVFSGGAVGLGVTRQEIIVTSEGIVAQGIVRRWALRWREIEDFELIAVQPNRISYRRGRDDHPYVFLTKEGTKRVRLLMGNALALPSNFGLEASWIVVNLRSWRGKFSGL